MEHEANWEKQFLDDLGFKDDEQLRRYLRKLSAFLESLDPQEKRVFLASLPSTQNALGTFQLDITQQQLEEFLRKREGLPGNTILNVHKINGGEGW